MKYTLLLCCLLFSKILLAQNDPMLLIDGDTVSMKSGLSLPYWLKAGHTIALGNNVKSASILEFTIDSNQLQFSDVISLTSIQTVPPAKAWKIEALACKVNTANAGDVLTWNGSNWVASGNNSSNKPTVTTNVATGEYVAGSITNDGGNTITAKGICYGLSPNPIVTGLHTDEGSGAAPFTSTFGFLLLDTTYYYRAYATNSSGTGYGATYTIIFHSQIGQVYGGGIIAYVLQPSDSGYDANVPHGLIAAAAAANNPTYPWGCEGSPIIGADGSDVGTGNQNTIDIINGCSTAGIAAKICSDLVVIGYGDWYLPSIKELEKLYFNRLAIGGFINNWYWSSTESSYYTNQYSYALNFAPGYAGYYTFQNKSSTYQIRAIRSF